MTTNPIRYCDADWFKYIIRQHLQSHPFQPISQSYMAIKNKIPYTQTTFNTLYFKIKRDIRDGKSTLPVIDNNNHISRPTRYKRLCKMQHLLLKQTTKEDIIWLLDNLSNMHYIY